ncbi:hypothetical protein [Spirosoma endophyticum]|uniref:Uncharacterized protein n=1 Tax=Spirosoma endophyticum TaxID=662367 RepID=A0A1I1XVQ7_9BACT|nr:hypothetical protein [Spirosoma endophyticum]SFE10758.1 hypothetical protein SAMN05216167_110117 [Spirosoma endophyticum]
MENYQSRAYQVHTPVNQLKESIRDMVRLQRDYQISDELFWEIFNARVLLNEHLDVNTFLSDLNIPVAQA